MRDRESRSRLNRLIIFAVVVALAAAYLFAQGPKTPKAPPPGALAVTTGTTTQVGASAVANFSMERDRVQSEQMAEDASIAQDPTTSATAKAQAESDYLAMSRIMTQEREIESLLQVKGFGQTAVLITQKGAVVVVPRASLTAAEALTIAMEVQALTGLGLNQVSVVPQ